MRRRHYWQIITMLAHFLACIPDLPIYITKSIYDQNLDLEEPKFKRVSVVLCVYFPFHPFISSGVRATVISHPRPSQSMCGPLWPRPPAAFTKCGRLCAFIVFLLPEPLLPIRPPHLSHFYFYVSTVPNEPLTLTSIPSNISTSSWCTVTKPGSTMLPRSGRSTR